MSDLIKKVFFVRYYSVILHPLTSPDGGIGRRARLKILFSKGSAGSIPVLGTSTKKAIFE